MSELDTRDLPDDYPKCFHSREDERVIPDWPDYRHTHWCLRFQGHPGGHICRGCDQEWPARAH